MESIGQLDVGIAVTVALALLVGSVLGARWARRSAQDDVASDRTETTGIAVLMREVERARRYERPMTLLFLPNGAFRDVDGNPRSSLDQGTFAALVGSLRALDFAWIEDEGVQLVLPEAAQEEAAACLRRLRAAIPGLDGSLARSAVFPDDGVTIGALSALVADRPAALPERLDLPIILRGPAVKEAS
jgi:hypothetical protein